VLAAVRTSEPSPELRSAEELLVEIERVNELVLKKVEISPDETRRRYERELAPRLDEIRRLVAARASRARNAAEDTLVRLREFWITASAPMA
jgi:hypothetical protein